MEGMRLLKQNSAWRFIRHNFVIAILVVPWLGSELYQDPCLYEQPMARLSSCRVQHIDTTEQTARCGNILISQVHHQDRTWGWSNQGHETVAVHESPEANYGNDQRTMCCPVAGDHNGHGWCMDYAANEAIFAWPKSGQLHMHV